MKKWFPTLVTLAGTAITVASPAIQQTLVSFAANHTKSAAAISAGLGLFAHWWPSPLSNSNENKG